MMRRICILLTGLLTALAASAQVTYGQADSIKVCSLLQQARPDTPLLWFARQFLGVPYVAHTLEVNASEQLVVNTRQLDCTTLVETVAALALCAREGKSRWADYLGLLQRLRYRQGRLDGYPSRLHYFSDWIIDKTAMGLVEEVQKPNPPFTAVQKLAVNYMSRHPKSYRALAANPALLPAIRQQEKALTGRTFRYIPKSAVKNTRLLRQTIRDGDIIATTGEVMNYEVNGISGSPDAPTRISFVNTGELPQTGWYTVNGIKLQKAPTQSGVYIYNGNKKVIK